MKTKAITVQVAYKLCGVMKTKNYPIRTKGGHLMTHRLEQLVDGNLGSKYGYDDRNLVEFVGIIWHKPYVILKELAADRNAMQAKILAMDGHSLLTDADVGLVPEAAPDDYITGMVKEELRLRHALKKELRLLTKL